MPRGSSRQRLTLPRPFSVGRAWPLRAALWLWRLELRWAHRAGRVAPGMLGVKLGKQPHAHRHERFAAALPGLVPGRSRLATAWSHGLVLLHCSLYTDRRIKREHAPRLPRPPREPFGQVAMTQVRPFCRPRKAASASAWGLQNLGTSGLGLSWSPD